MGKVIYFDNDDQQNEACCGQAYRRFLDYAFERTDYFMLVYVNYNGKGYSKTMKYYRDTLKPFAVKSRKNPSWPGVPSTYSSHTTYKVVFYRSNPKAKELLKKVNKLSDWSCPNYPQDLAFFKGNQCWFYSVGHEKIAAIIHATDEDLNFVVDNELALRDAAFVPKDNYFDAYNEELNSDSYMPDRQDNK